MKSLFNRILVVIVDFLNDIGSQFAIQIPHSPFSAINHNCKSDITTHSWRKSLTNNEHYRRQLKNC